MAANAYYKTACDNCRGRIEYPTDLTGHLVACPHCGHLTRLALPQSLLPAGLKPSGESTAQLLERVRRDSGYPRLRSVIVAIHVILLVAGGLSLILGLWVSLEPSALPVPGSPPVYGTVLIAAGGTLILLAMILKPALSLLVDIADAILDATRRIAPK